MDNIYGKKLPNEILPTVSGDDFIIVETHGGGVLKWIDSGGIHTLLDIDRAFPVGTIICRADEVNPASYLDGTWTKIAQGRTIIGASNSYPLNSTGGSADAVVVEHTHKGLYFNSVSPDRRIAADTGNTMAGNGFIDWTSQSPYTDSDNFVTGYAGESGVGKNMQPYLAKNIWQRIA